MTAESDLTPEDIAAFAQYHRSQPSAAGDFRLMR
jgi:hypothetical protein